MTLSAAAMPGDHHVSMETSPSERIIAEQNEVSNMDCPDMHCPACFTGEMVLPSCSDCFMVQDTPVPFRSVLRIQIEGPSVRRSACVLKIDWHDALEERHLRNDEHHHFESREMPLVLRL